MPIDSLIEYINEYVDPVELLDILDLPIEDLTEHLRNAIIDNADKLIEELELGE